MIYHLLIAVVGVVGLLAVWLITQAIIRRLSPEFSSESDVLECKTCGSPEDCHSCGHNPERHQ